jgi:hypothetical protein
MPGNNMIKGLTALQVNSYNRDGFVIAQGLFTKDETDKLYAEAIDDNAIKENSFGTVDQAGKQTKLALWFTPGDDIFGLLSRSRRVVSSVESLLNSDAPVCHYHSKLMQKEPRVGGAWEWHQDFGYWYKNQFMFPDQMLSVMIALSECTIENGCLQVIKGSHQLGRVNHGFSGEQVGADMTMVSNALKTMELVYCVMKPGDVLFFHSNTLHRSEANTSEKPRWTFISAYTSQSNLAYNEISSAYKVPVKVVDDDAILKWSRGKENSNNRDFLRKEEDPSLKETGWEKEVRTNVL